MPESLIYSSCPADAARSESTNPSRTRTHSLHPGELRKSFRTCSNFSLSFSWFLNDIVKDSRSSQNR